MKITFTLLLICMSVCTYAQGTYSIKGSVRDSVLHINLPNATVSVLNTKDSTLVGFSRVTETGIFSISSLDKGSYLLIVTYRGYADYIERFNLDSIKTAVDFGNISMSLKTRLLNEVLIKGTVTAIKIKGDTTEYNAKAYTIQPNSKVEDLLRQLPGIQVDKDGKITAQGQTVQKVLVDGEEFFGDDPTLVTKNIRGDMVDKVQLYDKKSDQATFTGIDDGQKTKTINIKLKEDKKNGYFGKLNAGVGTNGYYGGQGFYNKFKGKKKFSLYGTFGNTGETGLSWRDNNKLGVGGGLQFADDGTVFFDAGDGGALDSFSGKYDGQGIPITRTGGVHYDDKWKDDKYTLNTNYKAGSIGVEGTRDNLQQQNLPGASTNIIKSSTNEIFNNFMFRQKLDATYSIKLDTTSNLKIGVEGTLKNSDTHNTKDAESKRNDSTLINTNHRMVTNKVDDQLYGASLLYNKKLNKPGRTISLNTTAGATERKSSGNLKSRLDIYGTTGLLTGTQLLDQLKTDNTTTSRLGTNLTYTEPISKSLTASVSYGFGLNTSNADRRSYDASSPNNYNLLNDSLSNHYLFNQTSNQAGLNFNYKKGKSILRFGTRVADVNYKQTDEITGTSLHRSFTNWSPQASFSHQFSSNNSFIINYSGSQLQPTIDQLQPVRVNTDPVNITVGNPFLKPAFTNSFFGYYNNYKVITEQMFYINSNYSFTTNPIVSDVVTDITSAKSVIQSVNLPGKKESNYSVYTQFNRKLTPGGLFISTTLNTSGNIYYSMVNHQLNKTTSSTYGGTLGLTLYQVKKYSLSFNTGPSYNIGKASLQPDQNNNGRGFNANYYILLYLPGKFMFISDGNYQYTAATQSFATDFRKTIINASLTRTFFKAENLKLVVTGNDLLNQNTGFTRTASSNLISENRYTTIRRFFMLSVVWDFTGMGGPAPKQ
jgi:hypothetical protein